MNCHDVDRWLDDRSPDDERTAMLMHVRICARCSAALGAMDALESALTAAPAPPRAFTERVMARVAETAQMRATVPVLEVLPLLRAFPWWARLALEPAALLAAVLAAVLVWRGDALFTLARVGALQLGAWLAQISTGTAAVVAPVNPLALALTPTVLACVALAVAPLVFMGSRLLADWSATMVGRHARPL